MVGRCTAIARDVRDVLVYLPEIVLVDARRRGIPAPSARVPRWCGWCRGDQRHHHGGGGADVDVDHHDPDRASTSPSGAESVGLILNVKTYLGAINHLQVDLGSWKSTCGLISAQ